MTAPMDCRLIGRWRIVEADLWDRDYLDLVAPATMTIGADGHGEIAYGAMQASLELEYSRSMVFFTWAGFDEGDEITGSGSAELNDDGTIEIAFAYHLGDEAVLKAERMTSSDRVMGLPLGGERRSLLDGERAGGVTMTYFAGLDVGLEETAICIIDSNGRIVRELRACSEPEALVRALRALDVRYGRVGLEACPLSSWLFEGLAAAGLPVVCLEVRHLRAALAAMTHKTDRNDARGIAQVLRTGWFKAVHVKTAWSQERRTLLTARKRMLEQAFDVENTIRGLLKGHGLKVGRVTRTTFAPRVRELVAAVPVVAAAIEPLLTAHATLRKSFAELHRQVLAVTRIDPVSRRLMTVPGIGAVTALAYCSAVDIPERFPRSRAVGAHFGLVPRKYQSGTTDRNGRITKAGDAMVRTALYEAANVLLTRVTRWSPLKAWAVRLAQRIGGKRAKVALARKLAVILHRIWIDGTTFTWTRERAMAAV